MVVTCSDEARHAMGLVGPMTVPGYSPIHVLEASWSMQACPVEALLSRQRELTLLEKYTLRAFHEIPGVTAAQIADRLGLKEPELIEETLHALQSADAIEASISNDSDEDIAEAREELSLLEQKMDANVFQGIVKTQKRREIEDLQQKIFKAESSKGLSIMERISKALERLLKFTAKLTARGQKHLAEGTITEPAKMVVYDLTRSLADGVVMFTYGHGFSRNDLSDSATYWVPLEGLEENPTHPSESDVDSALRKSGNLEGKLVIQRLQPQLDLNAKQYLNICITLAISHEDDTCRFIVHSHRNGNRLLWIENAINSDPRLEKVLLGRFEELLPKARPSNKSDLLQPSKAKPLVLARRLIREADWSGSHGMVIVKEPEALYKLVDCEDTLDDLLENRTSVELKNIKKWNLESDGDSLRFSLPSTDANLPTGSFATMDAAVHPGVVKVVWNGGKNTTHFPALIQSEELGRTSVIEIEKRLKSEIDSRACFLLTRSQPDFVNWINEQLAEMKKIEQVALVMEGALDLAKGTGIDIQRTLLENLFSKRYDLFADMPAACLKLVTILPDCWSFVEPYIQQALLDSSLVEGGVGSLSHTWKLHQNGTKELPWEDAAQLEAAYYGHCNLTRFDANRNFEDLITEMAENNGVSTESVFVSIGGLERAGIIHRELKNEASDVRMARNDFSHELGVQADLEFTLRVIAVIRKLDEISLQRTTGLWAASLKKDWNQTMSEVEMMSYLSSVNNIVQHAQDQGYTCLGSVWTGALRQGMPTTFETLPIDLISALNDAPLMDHPPQFSDMIEQVVDNSLDGWLEKLQKPKRLEITSEVQQVIDTFTSMEMEEMGPHIVSKFLKGIDEPTTIDDLMEELNNLENLSKAINISDLRGRWKRSIKNTSFVCDLADLAEINPSSLEDLGQNLAGELLKSALKHQLSTIESYDVSSVKDLCQSVESLQDVDKVWEKACGSIDGFLSNQVTRKIRPRGIEKSQLIQVGSQVEKMMPIIDSESFPQTNTHFENAISAAEKVKEDQT